MSDNMLYGLALVIVGMAVMGLGVKQLWEVRVPRLLVGAALIGVALGCIRGGVAILPDGSDAQQVLVACIWLIVIVVLMLVGTVQICDGIGELEVVHAFDRRDVPTAMVLFCSGMVAIGYAIAAVAMS